MIQEREGERRTQRPWLPVLLAVMLGAIAWLVLAGTRGVVFFAPRPAVAQEAQDPPRRVAATLQSASREVIASRVAGILLRYHVKEGQWLEAEQRVASLDSRVAKLQVTAAEARLRAARAVAEAARLEEGAVDELFRGGAATKQERERARAAMESAEAKYYEGRAELAILQQRLAATELKSTIPGVVLRMHKVPGEALLAYESLCEIANPKKLLAVARVPREQSRKLEIGQELRFHSSHGKVFVGRVETIGQRINPGADTTTIQVRLENPDLVLAIGGRGQLELGGK